MTISIAATEYRDHAQAAACRRMWSAAALAGIDADPERMADVAVDLTALDRLKRLLGVEE